METYFPHLTFVRRLRSPVLEEKNAGGYQCYCVPYVLSVTSSVKITCTYYFNADDIHLKKWKILSSMICRYTSLTNFVRKFYREIIWNFCVTCLQNPAFAQNTFSIIFSAIIHRLLKSYSIFNKGQSWHSTNDPSHMVEIISIPWTNTWSATKYFVTKCGFRTVHIWPSSSWYFLGLNAGAFHMTIKCGSLWDLKLC